MYNIMMQHKRTDDLGRVKYDPWQVLQSGLHNMDDAVARMKWFEDLNKERKNTTFCITEGRPYVVTDIETMNYPWSNNITVRITRYLNLTPMVSKSGTVTLTLDVQVVVLCPLYKVKKFVPKVSFSAALSDEQIINSVELNNELSNRLGF